MRGKFSSRRTGFLGTHPKNTDDVLLNSLQHGRGGLEFEKKAVCKNIVKF
jgi:hypothetical protein